MSLEFNTRVDYEYQGGDAIFSVPFPYINKSHIVVVINGDIENPITNFTWLSECQIVLNNEINTGDIVSIRRHTPIDDKMVVFTDNNILDGDTQNLAQDQVYNVVQELNDNQSELKENLDEYVNIKDAINDQMEEIAAAAEVAETSIDLLQDTRELVNDISNTYEQLKQETAKGLNATVTHNLFAIEVFDKTLSEEELVGWALQDTQVNYSNYPDAFVTINQEYDEGTLKTYQNNEVGLISKKLDIEDSTPIYIDNVDITSGIQAYSDITRETSLGNITDYSILEVDKYKLTENSVEATESDIFVAKDTIILANTVLYSDKLLNNILGTVSTIEEKTVNKYTSPHSGEFYIAAEELFRRGQTIYADGLLTRPKGVLTYVGSIDVDQYSIAGAAFTTFFVPKGTEITVGTEIFADSTLTTSLGEINARGLSSSNVSYYYSYTDQEGKNKRYFYTKKKLPDEEFVDGNTKDYYIYTNKLCTEPNPPQQVLVWMPKNDGYGATLLLNDRYKCYHVKYVSSSNTGSGIPYICLEGNTTKYSYYKQASLTNIPVIAIDEGNYEGYLLNGIVTNEYITLDTNISYSSEKIGSLSSQTVTIGEGTKQSVLDVTLVSSSGILFEYKEHTNGHKIVLSSYLTQIEAYKEANNTSEYYLLNKINEYIVLPLLNSSKKVYLCVGNTKLINAGITYDEAILEDCKFLINSFGEILNRIYTMLGITQTEANLIIEEL